MGQSKDLKFLKEIREKLIRGHDGDVTDLQFAMQMIDDWIGELETAQGRE